MGSEASTPQRIPLPASYPDLLVRYRLRNSIVRLMLGDIQRGSEIAAAVKRQTSARRTNPISSPNDVEITATDTSYLWK